jgi:predicted lysophospholipase L1 biosynthesis ABC-type transport system permease subunit
VGIVFGITALVALTVTAAGTLVAFPALWRDFRRDWQRIPPEGRRQVRIGWAIALVWVVPAAALAIIAPWGPDSIVWVILIGGGVPMLLALGGIFVQARRDIRRARARRPPEP